MSVTNTVFVITGVTDTAKMDAAVEAVYGEEMRKKLGNGQWIVKSGPDTSAAVYEKLKVYVGEDVTCVIFPMVDYYGYYDKSLWDWVSVSPESSD